MNDSIRDQRSEQPAPEQPTDEPEGGGDAEELPDEAVADPPEGEPEDTPDAEVDGGGAPAKKHTWD